MKKRTLITLFAALLLVTAAFVAAAQTQGTVEPNAISQVVLDVGGGNNPVCPYCGQQPDGGWIALEDGLSAAQRLNGHYYVPGYRSNSSYYTVMSGDSACVFLNGLTIESTDYAFQVEGGTLTIMGQGGVYGGHSQYAAVGATIDVVSGTLNLCGGTYTKSASSASAVVAVRGTGSVVNMYNGTTIADGNVNNYEGGNVRISAEATFNMYGGTISAGLAYCGGNVALLSDGARFNMYGGSVVDGKAQLASGDLFNEEEAQYAMGGNIYVPKGNFAQSNGATITGGSAYTGGNLYISSGNTVQLAGQISGGSAYTGGNVDARAGSKLVLGTGALVTGGEAQYDGGNFQLYNATLELAGGNINGGTAERWGGSVMADGSTAKVLMQSGKLSGGEAGVHGGNICADNGAQVALTGGTVTGGKALNETEGRGGNIYIADASLTVTAGTVTMGRAAVSGGNLHIQETAETIEIDGCTFEHGQAAAGGNICIMGVADTYVKIGKNAVITEGVSQWPKGSSFAGGGGNIFCQGGKMDIYGKVSLGTANLTGGNIELRNTVLQLLDGAQVSDGWADYDGGNICASSSATLVISDSAVTGGTAGRNGSNVCAEGWVSLEKTAQAADNGGIYLGSGAKLRVYASFDGDVALSGLELPTPVYGATLDTERFECTATFPGKLWLTQVQDKPCVFGKEQQLFVGAVYTVMDGVKTWYPDNAAAVAGYGEADYLVPQGDLELAGSNYVVDLAGQNLNITGTGRFTCFDSSNDTYETCGSARIDGPILMNQMAQTVNGKHYVRIKSNGIYTFHRIELKVSDVSLRVSSGGIYYSAWWECDDSVIPLIQSFGIGVSLADMPTEALRYDSDTKHTYHTRSEFVSGVKTNGVLIRDILKDYASAEADRVENNSTFGKMPIYAKAYVVLNNGIDREQTVISNDNVAVSLHDVLTSIDADMPLYYSAAQRMQDFQAYWAQNGLTGEDWDFEFHVPVELLQLQQTYSQTQMLTGQLHDRLESTADLSAWKNQMEAGSIDFASCLENGQVSYIGSSTWDSAAFIGGVEARFTVDDKTVDCNMLFASQQDLEAVLTGSGAFTYSNGSFQTKTLTSATFVSLINSVKSQGGLVLLAHPKEMGLIDSKDALDYWFADGIAVDIGTSEQNYKLWTDLLAEGKKVWAVTSNAGNLTGRADTVTLYTKEKSAQAMLSKLASGDFASGSLGLQMVVGDTFMGGKCSFEGVKLALCVDQATAGVLEDGHTYRVDLICKAGVVQSWVYTGRAMYEILDADANQAFYRLEVVDETTGQRIAVGNPIWNENYGLKAGFAREDITPDYPVLIVGTSSRVSQGVAENDGIFLTCVALQEGGETYLIYTADFIGADSSRYVAAAKMAVSQATGVPKGNITISTTHTHSSVGIAQDHWTFETENDGDENLARFRSDFNAAAVRTAQSAIEDLTKVDAAYAGTVTGKKDVAFVRHYVKRNGTLDYSNDGSYDSADNWLASLKCQYKAHATEADNEIQLVKFQRADSKKDVVLMSVPSHATLNERSTVLSADFPHYARQYVEQNTNSLVAYFIGAAGDQVPRSKLSNYHLSQTLGVSNNTDPAAYGQKLGGYAVAALNSGLTQLRSTAVKITPAVYEGQVGTDHFDSYETALDLVQRYDAGEDVSSALKSAGFAGIYDARWTVHRYEYANKYGQGMDMNIKTMAIGDLGFIFAPYEMAGVNGSQIKSGSPYATTFIATCTDDSVSYVASQDAFDHESYEAQTTWFASGSGELLAKRFIEVLEQQKYNQR